VGPGPVWTGVKNLAQPGFDPRTAQPVASRLPTELPGPLLCVKQTKKNIHFMKSPRISMRL